MNKVNSKNTRQVWMKFLAFHEHRKLETAWTDGFWIQEGTCTPEIAEQKANDFISAN